MQSNVVKIRPQRLGMKMIESKESENKNKDIYTYSRDKIFSCFWHHEKENYSSLVLQGPQFKQQNKI